jgi:tetratricopeptide (TPR) repeat protein
VRPMKAKWTTLWLGILVTLYTGALPMNAASESKADRQFASISNLLEKADREREKGNGEEAGKLYGATIAAYQEFHRNFPDAWVELTQFRTAYCRNQLMKLLAAQRASTIKAEPKEVVAPPPPLPPELAKPVSESIAFCRVGRYDDAEKAMQALIEEYPNCSAAYLVWGTACVGKGNLDMATTLIKRAIALEPKSKAAHYDLCQLLIRADEPDFDAARMHYQQAIRLGAEPDGDLKAVLGLE